MNRVDAIPTPTVDRFEEWRQHWLILFCSAVGASMAMMAVGSLGVFLLPIQHDFGWSRAQISAGFTIYAIVGVVGAPVIGRFIDRFGARKIGIGGAVSEGIAFALFALATGSIVSWFVLWVIFSIATQGTRPVVWTAAVSGCFDKGRGPAMAIVFVGLAIGSMISPVLADRLISTSGWRSAYVIIGMSWGGLTALLCYLFFRPPVPKPSKPAGTTSEAEATSVAVLPILRSRPFILLAIAMFLGNALNMAFSIHMVPFLVSGGMPASQAALLVGFGGIASISGSLICGMLVTRLQGSLVAGIIALGPILSCCLFLFGHGEPIGRVVPVLLFSLTAGSQTHLFAYLVSRHFDLRVYGTIYGILSALVAVAVGVGPVLGGIIFDTFKNYQPMIIGAIPVALAISLLLLSLGRDRNLR